VVSGIVFRVEGVKIDKKPEFGFFGRLALKLDVVWMVNASNHSRDVST
jgi:hypothetical protein